MKQAMNSVLVLVIAIGLLSLAGCSNNPPATAPPATTPATAVSPAAAPTTANSNAPGVSFTADPNPIKVCDGSNLGIANLQWKTPGVKEVEIHVNSPDGPLMARGGAEGQGPTHKWVTNGMVFYLQDMTGMNKTPAQRTIATLTVNLTTAGCP